MAKANNDARQYNGSDRNMLTACSVIMNHAMDGEIKLFLQNKRSNWTDAFLKALEDRIKAAFKDVLGVDNLGDQTSATKVLQKAMDEVLPKVSSFKKQVEADFEDDDREKEILDKLGFKLFAMAEKGDQGALVELLMSFNKNMTDALATEIADAGTDKAYITDIKGYADVINNGNIAQEAAKGTKKKLTAADVAVLNGIYKDVMKVAKIAHGLYVEVKDDQRAELFSYNKIVKTLNNTPAPKGGKK